MHEGKKFSGKCCNCARAQNNSLRSSSQKGLGAKTNRRAKLAEKINWKADRLARLADLTALYFHVSMFVAGLMQLCGWRIVFTRASTRRRSDKLLELK